MLIICILPSNKHLISLMNIGGKKKRNSVSQKRHLISGNLLKICLSFFFKVCIIEMNSLHVLQDIHVIYGIAWQYHDEQDFS